MSPTLQESWGFALPPASQLLQLGGLVAAAAAALVGCAVLWHQVNGFATTALEARQLTHAVFDYVFLICFAVAAVLGEMFKQPGVARVGLLGLATIAILVHTGSSTNSTIGHGWPNANAYRLAEHDARQYPFTLSSADANKSLLGGTTLCFISALLALVAAVPYFRKDRRPTNKLALNLALLAAVLIFTLCIVWWESSLTSLLPAATSLAEILQSIVYQLSLFVTAFVVLILFIMLVGIAFDVQEYVAVAGFFAAAVFAVELTVCFRIRILLPFSALASEDKDDDKLRAGAAIFYAALFLLMCAAGAYFNTKFDALRDRKPVLFNYGFITAAVLCIVPGAAMLWHQASGLDFVTLTAQHESNEKSAVVAEAFGYVYVVILGLIGLVAGEMGRHGITAYCTMAAAGMMLELSTSGGQFSWANGNVFRLADDENLASQPIAYAAHGVPKQTLGSQSANHEVMGGFVLCQLAGYWTLISFLHLIADHQKNLRVLGLGFLALGIYVALGCIESAAESADVGASTYYQAMLFITNLFYLAILTLLGLVLANSEYLWLLVMLVAYSGLGLLGYGFGLANSIQKANMLTDDRAHIAGAFGFFTSLVVLVAAALHINGAPTPSAAAASANGHANGGGSHEVIVV